MNEILGRRTLRDKDYVFRQGDQGSSAFILQTGTVEIVIMTDNGEKVLAEIGQGGIFGEMALIDDQPRMASARVKGTATIVTVTKQMYEQKLKKTDPFIRALLRIVVETARSR